MLVRVEMSANTYRSKVIFAADVHNVARYVLRHILIHGQLMSPHSEMQKRIQFSLYPA